MTSDELEHRLNTILPEEYRECYEDVQPVSMGSAAIKYGADGKVAWDQMWATFCDLAMAGGPPHKGTLLEPGSAEAVAANPEAYKKVVAEIRRGVLMVTGLSIWPVKDMPGWVRIKCTGPAMGQWLARAIAMENISAHYEEEGSLLYLPAGPDYRVEKEIKNVVTTMAKTCHYWLEHTSVPQQRRIANMFAVMNEESPLIQPELKPAGDLIALAASIATSTALQATEHEYTGWLGLACPDVRSAVWLMRALTVCNVVARRQETTLFVPVNAATDPGGEHVTRALTVVHRLL